MTDQIRIEQIKLALRITSSAFDDEILDTIEAGRRELVRSGVSETVVEEEGALVADAIRAFVLSRMSNDQNIAKRYDESFRYQQDCLRKSSTV